MASNGTTAEIIAAHLTLTAWKEVQESYANLPVERRIDMLKAREPDIIARASVLRTIADNVVILSSPQAVRAREVAAANKAAVVAARGDGSIDAPLKSAPHLDRLNTNIQTVQNAERLNVLQATLASARATVTNRHLDLSRLENGSSGTTETVTLREQKAQARAAVAAAEADVRRIESEIAAAQTPTLRGSDAPGQNRDPRRVFGAPGQV